jgi:hypothetical protein
VNDVDDEEMREGRGGSAGNSKMDGEKTIDEGEADDIDDEDGALDSDDGTEMRGGCNAEDDEADVDDDDGGWRCLMRVETADSDEADGVADMVDNGGGKKPPDWSMARCAPVTPAATLAAAF